MATKILWHKNALEDFISIVEYYEEEGHIQAAVKFREKVNKKISFVSKYPTAGRPTAKRKNVKYILVDKNKRMYYRYTANTITLLAFFDSRQHPGKAPF